MHNLCITWRELKRLEDNVDPGGGAVDVDQVLDGLGSDEFCQHLRGLNLKLDPVSSEPAVGIALYTGQQFKPEDKSLIRNTSTRRIMIIHTFN